MQFVTKRNIFQKKMNQTLAQCFEVKKNKTNAK